MGEPSLIRSRSLMLYDSATPAVGHGCRTLFHEQVGDNGLRAGERGLTADTACVLSVSSM
jgi:hypothetical protein